MRTWPAGAAWTQRSQRTHSSPFSLTTTTLPRAGVAGPPLGPPPRGETWRASRPRLRQRLLDQPRDLRYLLRHADAGLGQAADLLGGGVLLALDDGAGGAEA